MTCEQARSLIGSYLDGEVTDIVRVQEIESHIAECAGCAQEMTSLQALSTGVRQQAPYFEAPMSLEDRIRARTIGKPVEREEVRPPRRRWILSLSTFGATAFACLAALFFFMRLSGGQSLESELVADHFRSLQANHLFDVPSSDKHTVKPWFQGKIDFSPNVPDLKNVGFPLLGGRLDYLDHRPVAALVYGRAKHVINVFVIHRTSSGSGSSSGADGYHLVRWLDGDLEYWAVSDLNASELEDFVKAFRAA